MLVAFERTHTSTLFCLAVWVRVFVADALFFVGVHTDFLAIHITLTQLEAHTDTHAAKKEKKILEC